MSSSGDVSLDPSFGRRTEQALIFFVLFGIGGTPRSAQSALLIGRGTCQLPHPF